MVYFISLFLLFLLYYYILVYVKIIDSKWLEIGLVNSGLLWFLGMMDYRKEYFFVVIFFNMYKIFFIGE